MEAFWKKIAEILFLSRLEKRWRKVAKVLAVFVVFWTTYMLILPAITLEKETYCGLDEHLHGDNCYVIESTLICGYEADELQENVELTSGVNETLTEEETTAEETTDEETSSEETTAEETTAEKTIAEASETTEEIHIHSAECYEDKKTLICTDDEHSHQEACFIEDMAMYAVSPIADGEDEIAVIADSEYATRVNFDNLDGTGSTYYIVYTLYNGTYYAVPGTQNGKPLAITVNSDGTIPVASLGNNYYWSFMLQSGSAYIIQNLGSGRYMHSYNNSSSDYGITTAGKYSSDLISSGSGSTKTFSVKSNSNYSRLTGSGSGVAFSTTTTAGSAAQYYIAEVYIPQDVFHVWFDGTCGGIMSLYESPNEYLSVPGDNNTITLPETWISPSKYTYTLNGWYDIKNHKYYKPGAKVTITKNTVFYADWVAGTYDVGIVNDDNINLIAPSLDTNSFIRTDMFDYSAVFNMQAVTHTGSVSASSHSETWTVVQNSAVPYNNMPSLGFTFRDWDSGNVHISYAGNRARLNDNVGTEITSGIVDYVKDMSGRDIIDILFNPDTDIIGKNYVGKANFLYQFMEEGSENYDGEHNGYYYYDSRYNAASYNQTNERFYIYEYLERTSDSLKDSCNSDGSLKNAGGYSDFLPFNSPYVNNHNNKTIVMYDDGDGIDDNYQYDAKATNQSSAIANVGTNYWFGMKSEIKFYLPDDTGTVDAYQNYGNISSHGQHMTFEFSGDDDMWVFIDGELVMDIGGLHGIMEGKIDFSTGVITTSEAAPISAGSAAGSGVAVNKELHLEEGDHTLTVYYMERGGSQSNCAIYFNITPRYSLELVKQDSVSGSVLDGAVFAVYTDMDCTEPAVLWSSEAAYQNGEDSTNIFTAVNGKVSFWGISAGKVYYIKEVAAPVGYPVSDDLIRISMNNLGNAICKADVLRGEDGVHTEGFDIINNSADEVHQQIAISVSNQIWSAFKRNIAVIKHWDVEDSTLIPESVTVYLTANGKNTGRSAVLSDVNDWTYVWTELPVYDSNGNAIVYSVYEEQAEDFYTDVDVTENVPVNAWIQTDSFYDGGTFLIVNRSTGKALAVDSSGRFEWIDFETAKAAPSAHWIVNADGMGFHVVDEEGYHIILDGTDKFVPEKDGNRIIYYHQFDLAARYNNEYYYLSDNFSADTQSSLELELYINKDILINENESENDSGEDGDDEILVTMYTVTNTHIEKTQSTSFKVLKSWEDGAANHLHDSITVRLFANGIDTGRKLTLSNANGWEGSFEGLAFRDTDGNKIEYSVSEDAFTGYYPEYSEITETPSGETTVETTRPGWVDDTTLTDGEIYVFYSGNYALSRNGSSIVASSYNADNITDDQKWLVTIDGSNVYISNPNSPSSYFYATGTRNSATLSISASNRTAITYSTTNRRLSFSYTYSNRSYTRYFGISNGSLNTSTNSGATFSLKRYGTITEETTVTLQPSYNITITNKNAHYVLPETGGDGTHYLYIIGGLLITLGAVFLLCLYNKRDRGRRRKAFW